MTEWQRYQGESEHCGRCGHPYDRHRRPETPFGAMPCRDCDCVDLRPRRPEGEKRLISCPFCEIVARRSPTVILREWSDMVCFAPLNPVTEGHLLVVPRRHVTDALEVPWITGNAFMRAAQMGKKAPCNLITSVGVEATQTIRHLHVHVVPRRDGDGLKLPWTDQP